MRHRIVCVAAAVLGCLLVPAVWTGAAGAHGALENPVSRAAACGAESPLRSESAACAAAAMPAEWDDLRVANVEGRDREAIPDGKLCSGGLDAFKGLDLPRADWPATELTPGADFTFRYRGTIPHKGTFRMYVTKDGYDPARPLAWSDLERKPFLKVTDPAMADGSYVMESRLPSGRTGRHLIYTIWQNSDTPDTYYSCSDVVFAGAAARAEPAPAGQAAESPAVEDGDLTWVLGAVALLAAITVGAIILLARSNRR
ncbi:lytic polysaccharide monooxygenase auxiliary activity family 9 protein [Nonomuraea sp. LPB2021202275-12-8]|uniref:lytic polysaccharide monooxygenase auxiliary activity family 9 protein n=1 Tax=Nonomuraea sp. LPB2021202275-12-8 TaxID=3120159 RepID=UPI00300D30DC